MLHTPPNHINRLAALHFAIDTENGAQCSVKCQASCVQSMNRSAKRDCGPRSGVRRGGVKCWGQTWAGLAPLGGRAEVMPTEQAQAGCGVLASLADVQDAGMLPCCCSRVRGEDGDMHMQMSPWGPVARWNPLRGPVQLHAGVHSGCHSQPSRYIFFTTTAA